jgi:hypothetical protein
VPPFNWERAVKNKSCLNWGKTRWHRSSVRKYSSEILFGRLALENGGGRGGSVGSARTAAELPHFTCAICTARRAMEVVTRRVSRSLLQCVTIVSSNGHSLAWVALTEQHLASVATEHCNYCAKRNWISTVSLNARVVLSRVQGALSAAVVISEA